MVIFMPFSLSEICSFIGIVTLLVMIPGPNTVLVIESTGVNGRRAGFINVLGIMTALYFNAVLCGLGLALIIMQSAKIYNLLKLLGGGYLIYLDVKSLVDAYRLHRSDQSREFKVNADDKSGTPLLHKGGLTCYFKGILTGTLNPGVIVFFMSFFPQFMHQDGNILVQSLILTVLYSVLSAIWYGIIVFFVGKLRQFLMNWEIQKWLKVTTGTLLVGMGARIALQRQ